MSANPQTPPNRLAHESSPYLLQHAHNPVQWEPWGGEALGRAAAEDKPIIVSIGYSACHWCHVMERESFENEQVAALMNQNYVCIKVDREERPDVDAIYMDALHAMGLQGGWPLNVFLTSGAKPFYGGTYFPREQWMDVVAQIATAYMQQREQILESAESFTEHIARSDSQKYQLQSSGNAFSTEELQKIFDKLASQFDAELGGMQRESNKFPMPSIYLFLLRYWQQTKDKTALQQVKLTLDRMALGGIYDQLGGGFSRYSTDPEWFAPHFEKMLYDNGQLVSLYSEAFAATNDSLYKDIVYQTIGFIERELTSPEGGFYSALDADSEGEEGKFYVWTKSETDRVLGSENILFCGYYGITEEGNWEHGNNILHPVLRTEEFALKKGVSTEEINRIVSSGKQKLMAARESRIHPGLDDKILCSWNGLMLKGLADAYRIFGEVRFLDLALQNAHFLQAKMRRGQQLWHSYKNGKATIQGYLEDYAFVTDAYVTLYQATFNEQWLTAADELASYAIQNFYDAEEEMFFFTDAAAEKLIARKKELFDNVIPASNSAMARNLYWLGIMLDKAEYQEIAGKMLAKVKQLILTDGQYLTNWATLFASHTQPTAEVVVVGPQAEAFRREMERAYHPNKVLLGTTTTSSLLLLQGRTADNGRTTVYVCFNKSCRLPVHSVAEALAQLP